MSVFRKKGCPYQDNIKGCSYRKIYRWREQPDEVKMYNNKDKPTDPSEVEKTVNWWILHVKFGRCEIEHAPDWIKEDKRVAQSSIKANPWSIQFVKPFWSDTEMVSMAVSIRPEVLECLPRYWRDNPHVMKLAFESSMISYKYLGKTLKKLPGFERLLQYVDENSLGRGNFRLDRLEQQVSHELMKHDGFLLFLAGTLVQSLLISKLGGHYGLLKKKVSEFLGVPYGNLLWGLRTAKKYIEAGLERKKYYNS